MANTNHSDVTKEPAGQTPAPSRASSPGDYLDVPGQRALPTTPVRGRDATKLTTPPSKRSNSDASGDVSMNDIVRSGTRGSSASGTTTPGGRKRAKKPPQKFSCTDFPPCDLHFTRSEHLARHIRKHTGERPFECHCGRKFSRLDNLRQHSQTVHANEDIPENSLANTGGRGPYARDRRAILARQNNRQMQPLQQGPPRAIGHRRNVHSMPVNQMPPMYDTFHDTRGDMRRTPAAIQMTDPRGPAFNYPQPEGPYYSPESYQSSAPYNTPPSNRSSGHFTEHYQYQSSIDSPAFSQYASDRFPSRRQSISSVNAPYYDLPMRALGGPQLPPLNSGVRENFHPQSANMFENNPAPAFEHTHYSQTYARREDSIEIPDLRRRTWHVGYGRESMASGMHNMNLTPPEEARERPYIGYGQLRDFESLQLPPIRGAPLSPIRRQPSPEMEMQPRESSRNAEHEAADALQNLSKHTDMS